MKTIILKIKLFYDKKISRTIEVTEDISLYKLAEALVTTFDFDFDHAFGFYNKVTEDYYNSELQYELFADMPEEKEMHKSLSVKKHKAKDLWKNKKDKWLFLFDYGDEWLFVVEAKDFGEAETSKKYPTLKESKGKAPEQYLFD